MATIPRSRDPRDDASTWSPLRQGSMASSQRVFVATSLKEGVVITLPASSNVGDLAGVLSLRGGLCARLAAAQRFQRRTHGVFKTQVPRRVTLQAALRASGPKIGVTLSSPH